MTRTNWQRVICGSCREGTLFFTKEKLALGYQPVHEYAIKSDFTIPVYKENPYCDTCGTPWKGNPSPNIEDVQVVTDEDTWELLEGLQQGRDSTD